MEEEIMSEDEYESSEFNEEDDYDETQEEENTLQVIDMDILSSDEEEVLVRLILKEGTWTKLRLEKKVLQQLLNT